MFFLLLMAIQPRLQRNMFVNLDTTTAQVDTDGSDFRFADMDRTQPPAERSDHDPRSIFAPVVCGFESQSKCSVRIRMALPVFESEEELCLSISRGQQQASRFVGNP